MSTLRVRPVHVAVVAAVGLLIGIGVALAIDAGTADGGDTDATGDSTDEGPDPTTTEPDDPTTNGSDTTVEPTTSSSSTTMPRPPDPDDAALAALVASLTPEQKASQLVITGMGTGGGAAAGASCPGGVFINDRSDDAEGARGDFAAIRAADDDCPAGALILTDAEPGSGIVKVPISRDVYLPSSPDLFARYTNDPDAALADLGSAADAFAGALRDIGVDVNFGVLADVDVADDYYMASEGRSFGDDPAAVTALVETLVDRHCVAGVAATLKHFPNQGATREDPHDTGESVSTDDEAAWEGRGRIPYVDTPAPLVMTGHITMGDVDPNLPASVSFAHTTGLLREGLAYEGVIVTDDLAGMDAVTELPGLGTSAARAVQAIAAGADLALFVSAGPHDSAVQAIADRAGSDPVFARRVDESVTRVLRLKASFGLVPGIDDGAFPLCAPVGPPHLADPTPVAVVANGTDESGLASANASPLEAAGIATDTTNAAPAAETVVLHAEGAEQVAALVAAELGASSDLVTVTTRRAIAALLEKPEMGAADVWVVLGADHETALAFTEGG